MVEYSRRLHHLYFAFVHYRREDKTSSAEDPRAHFPSVSTFEPGVGLARLVSPIIVGPSFEWLMLSQ